MKCVKCGSQLQPGARFCISCGAPAPEEGTAAPQQQPVQPQYQQPVQPQYQQVVPQQPAPEKKKTGAAGIVIAVIVLLVAAAAIVAGILAPTYISYLKKAKSGSSRQLSYVKGNKLYYVRDVSGDSEPIAVSSVKNASDYTGSDLSGTFTADGTYLYFYSKVESSTSGKLCRVEVSKLKADEDKNEQLIEALVSGVADYALLDDSRFIYQDDSGNLYYYDGEDKNKIASGVNSYYIGEDECVYYSSAADDAGDAYRLDRYLVADDSSTNLIDNLDYVVAKTEDGWFYAIYNDETYLTELYYCSKDADRRLVASEVCNIVGADTADSKVYYVTQRTETVCYYDLVNDTYAEADANLTQPSALDYMTPCTEYDAMSDWDREYYSEYPEDIDYFYDWLYDDNSLDTGMVYYYSYHVDEDDNYIYGYYFYDDSNEQWYAFDDAAYFEAYDAYYDVADRISLRESLKEASEDIIYYDLNAWTPGSGQSDVALGITYTASLIENTGIVVYGKYAELGKVDWPEDAYGTWFVSDYIDECLDSSNVQYYYNCNGTENAWSSEWGEPQEVVTGSGICIGDDYYYYEQESDGEGNLCCYSGGKSKTVLKNISDAPVRRYNSGSYTAYTDYDYSTGGTLKLFDADGDSTKIASGVTSYCYIEDGLIVYMSDEKLYVYRGEDEDKIKLDSSVTSYTCNGAAGEILNY